MAYLCESCVYGGSVEYCNDRNQFDCRGCPAWVMVGNERYCNCWEAEYDYYMEGVISCEGYCEKNE